MADSHVTDILKSIVGELKEMARSEAVVGKPITVEGKTVIPVVKISVGFGAGGGEGQQDTKGSGFGGGGGGGASIEPAAFVVIDNESIALLPTSKGSLDSVIEAIPAVAQKIVKLAEGLRKKDESAKAKANDSGSDEPSE